MATGGRGRFVVIFPVFQGSSSMLGQLGASVQGTAHSTGNVASQIARDVDSQNGINAEAVGALIREARRVIIAARSALF